MVKLEYFVKYLARLKKKNLEEIKHFSHECLNPEFDGLSANFPTAMKCHVKIFATIFAVNGIWIMTPGSWEQNQQSVAAAMWIFSHAVLAICNGDQIMKEKSEKWMVTKYNWTFTPQLFISLWNLVGLSVLREPPHPDAIHVAWSCLKRQGMWKKDQEASYSHCHTQMCGKSNKPLAGFGR